MGNAEYSKFNHNPPSDSHEVAPLDHSFYAESYELRRRASTMTDVAVKWLSENIPLLIKEKLSCSRQPENTFSILSVGCGAGELDLEVLKKLVGKREYRIKYLGLEPNPIHRNRFIENLANLSLGEDACLSVQKNYFDTDKFDAPEQYDLVLLAHVLYYFSDPYEAIRLALRYTQKGGQVIIVHQTGTGIPQIQDLHMDDIKGNRSGMLTADEIKALLEQKTHPYQYYDTDAFLDVTECIRLSERGIKIMSFCMECDLCALEQEKISNIMESFKKFSRKDEFGKVYLREPLGFFILKPKSDSGIQERHPQDTDPVKDYWELSRNFDWQGVFKAQIQKHPGPVKLLDVACGTGRWLSALRHYIPLEQAPKSIVYVYDCIDPCATSIEQVSRNLPSYFHLGKQYINTIQDVDVTYGTYDLLWSMHGFYMIPREDLKTVLKKCANLLKRSGGGFIAMATRKSFYVDFYEQYLRIFHAGKGERFTSAEDVIEELRAQGIQHHVYHFFYEERIESEDYAGLEHYIKHEATVNSFNQDKKTKEFSTTQDITLEKLLSHSEMASYLKSFIRDSAYYFPLEIKLIYFSYQIH